MSTLTEAVPAADEAATVEMTYREAINAALDDSLAADPAVLLMGEDVDADGGVFKTNGGLVEKYGRERVRVTPIGENGFVGVALGHEPRWTAADRRDHVRRLPADGRRRDRQPAAEVPVHVRRPVQRPGDDPGHRRGDGPVRFSHAISRYNRAPIAFVREVLLVEPDAWQIEALRLFARGHTRVSIKSGHGVGKSCMAAWVILWFICTRAPYKVAITAPTSSQLFDVLWPEIGKWLQRLPEAWRALFTVTADHIVLKSDPECFVTARTSRPEQPEAMAGLHSRTFCSSPTRHPASTNVSTRPPPAPCPPPARSRC